MSYTPGPWTAKGSAYDYWGVYSPNGTLLAEAPFKYRPANIRLMAAAPEMKDLLRQAADELHAIGCGKDPADGLELSEHIAAFLLNLDGEEETK